jgi:uncharacterized protein YjdB/N-acetylmuramoyl-L-alanine amidase
MTVSKKFLSLCMSFVLAFTMLGGVAYANPAEEQESSSTEESKIEETESQDIFENEVSDVVEPPTTELESQASDTEEETAPAEADISRTVMQAEELIEYVYLDESIVSLHQEQNIAFGLLDQNAVITSAEAEFIRGDNQEIELFESELMVDNAVLFTMIFDDAADATSYTLAGISYQVEGSEERYYADFETVSEEQKGGSYYFDVVTSEVYDALSKNASEEGEVSALAIKDDGELVAVESVEEAIVIADSEGVYEKYEAAESIELTDGTGSSGSEESVDASGQSNNLLDGQSILSTIFSLIGPESAYAAPSGAKETYLIVALDPGHGGSETGAYSNGMSEKDLNWHIASSCKTELEKYTGVSVVLTRGQNEYVGLQARVDRAVTYGADVFVSLHNNAGGGTGAEVWVPNSSSYNYDTHTEGTALGNKILSQLSALGLENRGVKTRNSTNGGTYPGGGVSDYYSVINASRWAGIPGIIVEHAFMDNASDAAKLKDSNFLTQLGQADAKGIASQYGLITHSTAQSNSTVKYRAHVSSLGWQSYVYDKKVAGTEGKARGVEAFDIQLQNQGSTSGGIEYRSYNGSNWQAWVSNSAMSGSTGQSKSVQAIEVRLTGAMKDKYDVYYRVHVANVGWLGWAKNGASAGSIGYNYNAEAFEVILVAKDGAAPGSTATPLKKKGLDYRAHVANIGWQGWTSPPSTAGTTGKNYAMEAFQASIANQGYTGGITYDAHCAGIGWQGEKSNGAQAGTTGQSRQMEAIKIRLTGDLANYYDIYYRVHSASYGWLNWAKNGDPAGTAGYGLSMQAVEIQLVAKNGAAPTGSGKAYREKGTTNELVYKSHVASLGWQGLVTSPSTAGTTGRNLAMEALTIQFYDQMQSGDIQYAAHVANVGWQSPSKNGSQTGTTGQARQMEAIRISLTGNMASNYDIYYRVHCAYLGWTGWAKNGANCGSSGYGYSMQAIEIKVVAKNGAAPGSTSNTFYEKSQGTSILGSTNTNVDQMVRYYNSSGNSYPSGTYSSKGAANIRVFAQIAYEEAVAEGVKPEVLFCQAMKETGWLKFGNLVQPYQCNFGGLGATGTGVHGAVFPDVRTGLRAQVQHLKAYAVPGLTEAGLKYSCVDPRFNLVSKGSAATVEALNGKWAVPGVGYGESITSMINVMYRS